MASWHLRIAAEHLRRCGVIAYPTEAVFGLGCLPWDETAVFRILKLKRRRPGKGLIVVAGEFDQIEPLVRLADGDREKLLRTWPGPVTWLVRPGGLAPAWITGGNPRIAVRVSAHPVIRALCRRVGPIVSTSANPEGRIPARTASRVRAYFGNGIDFFVPGPAGGMAAPTQIRDLETGQRLR